MIESFLLLMILNAFVLFALSVGVFGVFMYHAQIANAYSRKQLGLMKPAKDAPKAGVYREAVQPDGSYQKIPYTPEARDKVMRNQRRELDEWLNGISTTELVEAELNGGSAESRRYSGSGL